MNMDNRAYEGSAVDWGLDPLFWTSVKLFVGDLHHVLLDSSESVFFIGNKHVARAVEVVGVVVSADTRSPKMTMYNVDDGTGVILCVVFSTPEEQADPDTRTIYQLGTTVRVEGRLSTFRDERQLVVRNVRAVDPNEEALGWLERLQLRKHII
ncbi:hypothetical protein IW140_003963 [Coemansia sp. RSA 1813]|nr:hypothetical protein LPJ74_003661 [Coemansia sp. RSA 1843]KAJ2213430.1 hypothetical protein EV179_003848 [Coemansia sp. RSA 487]KAJ2568326.1 hypothetical protein IW140_003963 [Coemansia sp. RSA 1813]